MPTLLRGDSDGAESVNACVGTDCGLGDATPSPSRDGRARFEEYRAPPSDSIWFAERDETQITAVKAATSEAPIPTTCARFNRLLVDQNPDEPEALVACPLAGFCDTVITAR